MRSERLELRPFGAGDEILLYALDADPEVRRYLDQPAAPTIDECRDIVGRLIAARCSNPELGYWVAHALAQNEPEFIGWFHLRPARQAPFDLELGYRLMRPFWSNGYATEGSRLLLAHAFEGLNAPRVIANTLEANLASRRVMEKLGMRLEATYLHDGRLPAVRYVIDRP